MKTFFTITALFFIAILISIYLAGYTSKMTRASRDTYAQKVTQQVEELTVAIEKATERISALEEENQTLKTAVATYGAKYKTTTSKKTVAPIVTKSAAVTPPKKTLTSSTVSLHTSQTDCWIIVNNNVYSVASYISMHPGGRNTILTQCGKDATQAFTNQGGEGKHSKTAWSVLGQFLVGTLGDTLN